MKRSKKVFRFLSSFFLYLLLVLLGIIALLFIAYLVDQYIAKKNNETRAPLFGAYVIISPSMVPNINVYDAVFTMRVPEKHIKLYDIITFLSQEIETSGTPITHRVVGILETADGERAYRTKGDNNASEDRALIRQSKVLGKVLLRIPMIGYVKTFLSSRLGWIIAIVIPCLGIIGYDILKLTGLIETKKKNKKVVREKRAEKIEVLNDENDRENSSENYTHYQDRKGIQLYDNKSSSTNDFAYRSDNITYDNGGFRYLSDDIDAQTNKLQYENDDIYKQKDDFISENIDTYYSGNRFRYQNEDAYRQNDSLKHKDEESLYQNDYFKYLYDDEND